MIPGLGLIEKLVIFGINLFVKNRADKEAMKRNFREFFRKSSHDSTRAAELHEEIEKIKKGPWEVKK